MVSACENPKSLTVTNLIIFVGLFLLAQPGLLVDKDESGNATYQVAATSIFALCTALFSYYVVSNTAALSPTVKSIIFIMILGLWYVLLSPGIIFEA